MIRFDCHAHVFERVVPSGRPRYLPDYVAPLAEWRGHLTRHGLLGGVLVQPSFFGFDNFELAAALAQLDRGRFAGVAVVDPEAEADLQSLARGGICGLRWNLVHGAPVPDLERPAVRRHLESVAAVGLHLEIHLESTRLAELLPRITGIGLAIVIDHFGLPVASDPRDEPWLKVLRSLPVDQRNRVFVKFSAPYRSSVPVALHAEALRHELGPERIVWGSDWPWTRHEGKFDYHHTVEWAHRWLGDDFDDRVAVSKLYGLCLDAQNLG
jgi:predicted TIM-barrel fold metal-dependent hydrolase